MTKDYSDPELSDAAKEVIDYLDWKGCGMTFSGLRTVLPHLTFGELNAALLELYDASEMNRLEVLGPEKAYPVFYAMGIRTAKVQPAPALAPAVAEVLPVDEPPASLSAALAVMRKTLTLPRAPAPAVLSPDEAVAVLEHAGWTPEPEEVIEERRVNVPDRRRLTALDVIRRWRLPFPLARVVEIIGESRKGDLAREDAAIAIRMIREQVRGDE